MELEQGIINQTFIFLRNENDNIFIGAMLTSKNNPNYNNYRLDKKYFLTDSRPFQESYFVPNILIKKLEWSPFIEVGKISQEGVQYILSKLEHTKAEYFEIYAKKSNKQ